MNFKKNLRCCISSPICHFLALTIGSLAIIEMMHLHAHYTMDKDVESYVHKFCKTNMKECERIVYID